MRLNRLLKREIFAIAVFTIFLIHVYIFKGDTLLRSIVPRNIVNFFNHVELSLYDHRVRSLGAEKQRITLDILENSTSQKNKKYEVGSIEFARHYDRMITESSSSRDVVILSIDEKTMAEIGHWPIRRDTYAKLLDRVFEDGEARAMAFDIVFKERGDEEPLERLRSLREFVSDENRVEIDRHLNFLDYDAKLESAFAKYSNKIVAGYSALQDFELSGIETPILSLPLQAKTYDIDESLRGILKKIPTIDGGIFNYEKLRFKIKNRGFFHFKLDEVDGVVRRAPLFQKSLVRYIDENGNFASESLEILKSLGFETWLLIDNVKNTPEKDNGEGLKISWSPFQMRSPIHDKLKAEIRAVMLKPNWLSNHQRDLIEKIISKLTLDRGGFTEYNIFLAKYAMGKFNKQSNPLGFLKELHYEIKYGSKILQNYLFKDVSVDVLDQFERTEEPEFLLNEIKPLLDNLDHNVELMIQDQLIEPIRRYIDVMYSFSDSERQKFYAYLRKNLVIDKNFIGRFYLFENLEQIAAKTSMDDKGTAYIKYQGGKQSYLTLSVTDVINRDKFRGSLYGFATPEMSLQNALKNKIVFLGPTALGINDWRVTPVDRQLDGVEIHANIFDMLRQGQVITRGDAEKYAETLLILFVACIVPFFLTRLGAKWGAIFTLGFLVGYYSFCNIKFFSDHRYYQFMPLAIQLIIFYLYLNTRNYIIEERERKKTRAAFSNYVNASVVDEVLKDPEMLKLGGTRKEVSVLFSDVRSFTTISEGLPPEELVSLMNEYLTEMTDLVLEYNGTLDKFIGDAVMAFWGAPINQKNHFELATLTAIDMNLKVNQMRPYFMQKYNVPIYVGIGISTGSAVVGNMGSISRFDYTMLGDTVNLGARLEGQTKNYGAELIISQTTYEYVKNWAATRFLDLIAVKGKTEPVKIYECPNRKKDCSEQFLEGLEKFNEAVNTYYLGRKFKEGIQVFQDLKKYRDGEDKACDLYIERCKNFLENPPEDAWNGVFVATSK